MAGERHGRGMGTACYEWIGLKLGQFQPSCTLLVTHLEETTLSWSVSVWVCFYFSMLFQLKILWLFTSHNLYTTFSLRYFRIASYSLLIRPLWLSLDLQVKELTLRRPLFNSSITPDFVILCVTENAIHKMSWERYKYNYFFSFCINYFPMTVRWA